MGNTSRNANRGEFYTPKHLCDLLYNITQEHIPKFEEDYLVWDSCWGTGNLTEGIAFNDLVCSTIQRMDIRKNKHKNKGSLKFQYDFLNSDVKQLTSIQSMWMGETELPPEVDNVLRDKEGKPILFYINPPYVATGIYGAHNTDTRVGQTTNAVKEVMREHGMQSACDQAYAQFLYKIMLMREAYDNKNISIAVICPPLFLTGRGYENFRRAFLGNFKFEYGALFKASEFKGLSDRWAISIQIYTPGETEDKKNFNFDLYENIDGTMEKVGTKVVYNLDEERTCMEWAKDELKPELNVFAEHTISSGCKVSNKKKVSWELGSLGYFFYRGNNIYHNENEVGVMCIPYGDGSGHSITKDNLDKTMAIFCARRCFSRYGANWVNDKDEYCIPDVESSAYKTLVENSIVYGLFNGSSHMTSLIIDDGRPGGYQVPNEFYHISLEDTKEAFDRHGVEMVGPGEFKDRYYLGRLNRALETGLVFKEGIELLEYYREIWDKTIPLRPEFNEKEPFYQVMHWDCGFYQLKWVIKDYYPEEFTQLQLMYRQYEDKLRPLIHDAGFLR